MMEQMQKIGDICAQMVDLAGLATYMKWTKMYSV